MVILDAHTHQIKKGGVVNLDYSNQSDIDKVDYFSRGIHPWLLSKDNEIERLLMEVEKISICSKLVAIGETGLDKLSARYEDQITLFHAHLDIAKKIKKPIIVHCVKSQNDILRALKYKKFNQKMMIHGFNGSREEAFNVIKNGHYIGVGPQLFSNFKINKYLHELPVEHLLLETDESDLDAKVILEKMSIHLNKNKHDLADMLNENFKLFFCL